MQEEGEGQGGGLLEQTAQWTRLLHDHVKTAFAHCSSKKKPTATSSTTAASLVEQLRQRYGLALAPRCGSRADAPAGEPKKDPPVVVLTGTEKGADASDAMQEDVTREEEDAGETPLSVGTCGTASSGGVAASSSAASTQGGGGGPVLDVNLERLVLWLFGFCGGSHHGLAFLDAREHKEGQLSQGPEQETHARRESQEEWRISLDAEDERTQRGVDSSSAYDLMKRAFLTLAPIVTKLIAAEGLRLSWQNQQISVHMWSLAIRACELEEESDIVPLLIDAIHVLLPSGTFEGFGEQLVRNTKVETLLAIIKQLQQLQMQKHIILTGQHIWLAQLLDHEEPQVREAALNLADVSECQREPLEWKVIQLAQHDSIPALRARSFSKLSSHICQSWSPSQAIATVIAGLEDNDLNVRHASTDLLWRIMQEYRHHWLPGVHGNLYRLMHAIADNMLFQPKDPRTLLRQVVDFVTKHFSSLETQIGELPPEVQHLIIMRVEAGSATRELNLEKNSKRCLKLLMSELTVTEWSAALLPIIEMRLGRNVSDWRWKESGLYLLRAIKKAARRNAQARSPGLVSIKEGPALTKVEDECVEHITAVLLCFDHSEARVRITACKTLKHLSDFTLTDKLRDVRLAITNALLKALRDPVPEVCVAALTATQVIMYKSVGDSTFAKHLIDGYMDAFDNFPKVHFQLLLSAVELWFELAMPESRTESLSRVVPSFLVRIESKAIALAMDEVFAALSALKKIIEEESKRQFQPYVQPVSECLQRLLTAHDQGIEPASFLSLRDGNDQEPLAVVLDIVDLLLRLDSNVLEFFSAPTLVSVVCQALKLEDETRISLVRSAFSILSELARLFPESIAQEVPSVLQLVSKWISSEAAAEAIRAIGFLACNDLLNIDAAWVTNVTKSIREHLSLEPPDKVILRSILRLACHHCSSIDPELARSCLPQLHTLTEAESSRSKHDETLGWANLLISEFSAADTQIALSTSPFSSSSSSSSSSLSPMRSPSRLPASLSVSPSASPSSLSPMRSPSRSPTAVSPGTENKMSLFFDFMRYIISDPYYTTPLEMNSNLVTAVRRALRAITPRTRSALESLVARVRFMQGGVALRTQFVETAARLLPEEQDLVRELRRALPTKP